MRLWRLIQSCDFLAILPMLFSSLEFIFLFLPICYFGYFFLAKKRLLTGSKIWLVVASLVFYSHWNVAYLPLILGSLAFNYYLGSSLSGHSWLSERVSRKVILAMGVGANLLLLGYFKYTDFLIENINALSSYSFELTNIVLPLAISFFTFQQIAYLVDSYKSEAKEYKLINYMLFVTFFPQLIAGPIVHHKEMMGQFESKYNYFPRNKNTVAGLVFFSIGLFKKIVIADTFSVWANSGFATVAAVDFITAWTTSLSYTFQLYFDFSGYCDMALGVALLFNIKLPINFNSPYKSLDIQDFWKRWHITLGRFLRDYVYIPLGGSKKGQYSTYTNLLLTFLIGGLWHGSSWMFVIWGALHGLALIVHRLWKQIGGNLPKAIAWLITFNFVNLTWVFFRAEDMNTAIGLMKGMAGLQGLASDITHVPTSSLAWLGANADWMFALMPSSLVANLFAVIFIPIAFYLVSLKNSIEIASSEASASTVVQSALMFVVSVYVMASSSSSVFLYFNF